MQSRKATCDAALPEAYIVACLVNGDWQRAMELIDELGPLPAYAPHLVTAAEQLLARHQYAAARPVAFRAVELDGSCAAAHAAWGRALLEEPQSDEPVDEAAEAALRRAVELDPGSVAGQVALGSLFLRQKRLLEARPYIERALELAPGDEGAREALRRLRKSVEATLSKNHPEAAALRRLSAQLHQQRAEPQPHSISLCLITRNEAARLARVVDSVRGLATEIVVVDTGSTDDTVRIAHRLKARVEQIPWEDDFAAARNHSLKLATGEWLLVLDADDEFDRGSVPALCDWLSHAPKADVVGLFRRYPHPQMRRDSVAIQPRLFRNGRGLHFEGAIHEQLVTEDKVVAQPDVILIATIYHHGGTDGPNAMGRRRERNSRILCRRLERDPDDLRAQFYLGLTRFEAEDWEAALSPLQATVDRASETDDFLPKAYACLGSALWKTHRPLDAEAIVRSGLERFPDHPELWFALGLVLDHLGRLDEAVAAHEAALRGRFGPSLNWHDWACREAKPHLALCDLKLSLEDPEAAARHLAAAERFSGPQPSYDQIRQAISQTEAERARRWEARERDLAALEARAGTGEPAAGAGLVGALVQGGQIERAGSFLEAWARREGDSPCVNLARGRLLLASGRTQKALEAFVSARECEPEMQDAWLGEARARLELGCPAEAEEALLEALRRDPDDAPVMKAVGEFYLRQQRWDEAARYLQQSVDRRDDAWEAWLWLGQARLVGGNLPSAIDCYQRAATLSGGNAAVRVALGEARAYLARQSPAAPEGEALAG